MTDNKQKWWQECTDFTVPIPLFLVNYLSPIFTCLGGVLTTFGSSGQTPKSWIRLGFTNEWSLWVGIALLLMGTLLAIFKDSKLRNYASLQQQLEKVTRERDRFEEDIDRTKEYSALSRKWLKVMTEALFGRVNPAVRISTYRYSPQEGVFYKTGRFCDHHDWQSDGRSTYKADGIIARAWKNNTAFDNDVPDPTDKKAFVDHHFTTWGLRKQDAESLRMPSRCYASYAVRDDEDSKIAVVVVESTEVGLVTESRMTEAGIEKELATLSKKLVRFKDMEPDPNFARNAGY